MKIGFGYDSHRLVSGRKLVLGGVEIPHDKGSLGHSDGDALLHALCDAILGAIGAGDIGKHFPDNDPAYKDISSLTLLRDVVELATQKGFAVNNVDCTVVLEHPKLAGYRDGMIDVIANVLSCSSKMVNIKAKTNEGMGLVGQGEGIAAFVVVTVEEEQVD